MVATTTTQIAKQMTAASGISAITAPPATATPLPPLKRSHTGKTWPAMAAAGGDGRPGVVREEPGDHDRDDALEDVGRHHGDAHLAAQGAEHVRRAEVPAADGAEVHAAGPPGQERERDRAEQVGQRHDERLGHGSSSASALTVALPENSRQRAIRK